MPPSTSSEHTQARQPAAAPWRLRQLVACLPRLLLVFSAVAWPQNMPSEYDVQAAYLFNFGKFIHLGSGQPVAQGPTFDICILGQDMGLDRMGRTLDQLVANKTIDNRPMRAVRVSDASQARTCSIIFISSSEGNDTREDLALLAGADVLTVGDASDFLDRGGMIQFVLESDHVRFNVNLDAVNRTHLVLSSELLRVAASVKGKPKPEGAR